MKSALRVIGLATLAALLWWAHTAIGQNQTPASPAGDWRSTGGQARGVVSQLLREYPFLVGDQDTQALQEGMREFGQANGQQVSIVSMRRVFTPEEIRQKMEQSDRHWEHGAQAVSGILARLPGFIELPADQVADISREVSVPYKGSLLMLRRAGRPGQVPAFSWHTINVSRRQEAEVKLNERGPFYCFLELTEPPAGRTSVTVVIAGATGAVARLHLAVTAPARLPVSVSVVDGEGKVTEAALGIYSPHGELMVPDSAVDFSRRGVFYENTRYRDHRGARYWPVEKNLTRCFFERGRFQIDLPEGTYRLMSTKGPEYNAVDRTFTVSAGGDNAVQVELHRWIDMSRLGWHSGDCHIHFARPNPSSNEPLRIWTQAEDLRMSNILRMGDLIGTNFEQYAFGVPGRYVGPGGAMVPGQEDPRTKILGHVIGLNLQQPIHNDKNYCLYGKVFDGVHSQGGLCGYAHVYDDLFTVRRDMALNVPRVTVDFAEIAEFGSVKTELYYEFLNLGFRLTAAGGSDAPWGGSAGDARTYVYTGKAFDADEWFQGLKAGHTFATLGPILDFTVDGRLPGTEIESRPGQRLKIHAQAMTGRGAAPLGPLQIVANGAVVREVEASANRAALDFELPVEGSMWLAARTKDAHTTPVYITVNGRRHWKTSDALPLIAARERDLDDIEKLIDIKDNRIQMGSRSDREDLNALRRDSRELLQMVREARGVYQKLRAEAERSRSLP